MPWRAGSLLRRPLALRCLRRCVDHARTTLETNARIGRWWRGALRTRPPDERLGGRRKRRHFIRIQRPHESGCYQNHQLCLLGPLRPAPKDLALGTYGVKSIFGAELSRTGTFRATIPMRLRSQWAIHPPNSSVLHRSAWQPSSFWVHGWQFPEAQDLWDGNWLNVTAHCGQSGASA